jgi:4-amino-4-deoxy-L-arabinose transferase-like glycosyltransferase
MLGGADAMGAVVLLLASPIVFVCSGAVMTDAILAACSSGALMCFWARVQGAGRIAEDLLYLLIGAGMLIKGPLVLALILVPIVGWTLTCSRPAHVWARFAWIRGAIIVAIVALPWYVLAELRNPGFLGYFIGGEHFGRFLVPGWSGDRYGWAHDEPIGTVWLYFLLGTLPWSPIVAFQVLTRGSEMRRRWRERRTLLLFAIWWAATPLVLFTFAANVTAPYVLPAVPGAVLAGATWLAGDVKARPGVGFSTAFARLSSISAAAIVAFVLVLIGLESSVMASTQKPVVQAVYEHHPVTSPILYWRHRYHSAEYYSAGRARPAQDADVIQALLGAKRDFSLVIDRRRIPDLPADVREALTIEAEIGALDVLSPAS